MQAEDARLLGEFGVMKKMYTQLQHLNRYGSLAKTAAICKSAVPVMYPSKKCSSLVKS